LSILVAKLLLCNTIFQEALLLIHAILPSFKKCPVLKFFKQIKTNEIKFAKKVSDSGRDYQFKRLFSRISKPGE